LSAGEFETVLSEMVVAVHLLAPRGFASAKALLVPFAAFGKSNCLPRHERQTKDFLYLSKGNATATAAREAN
jgi:hypothetical protein